MINGGWDVLQTAFVAWYWVETKGLTLEGIDKVFVGDEKPSTVTELRVECGDDPAPFKIDVETYEKI